jgi:hypothetical protein
MNYTSDLVLVARMLEFAGHEDFIVQTRNVYKIWIGKYLVKWPLGRPRRSLETDCGDRKWLEWAMCRVR